MKISRIVIGVIACLSLTACGKGTKVKREKFFEKCADIKKDNLRSISFFKAMGFKKDCEVIIKDCDALKFIKG